MIRLTILLLFISVFASAQDFPQKIVGKQRFTDSVQMSRYKNNGLLDSVLSTNTEGKLIMKKIVGTGAAVDTIYRVEGIDSIYYIIAGNIIPVKDSTGSGGSTDTASLSNRINLKVNISDTAAMLGPYVNTAGWGLIKSSQTLTVDTSAGKVATQTMLTNNVPSLTATRLGYGDGSNLLTGSSTLTFAVGTGIVTAPKLIVNSNTDGGGTNDARILIQGTINEPNGTHGVRDKTVITGTVTGTASFDAEAELGSAGASVEMVGFQSRQIINKPSGTLATAWAHLDNTQVISPVTSLVGIESHPYIYAGGSASNRFGIRILEYEGSSSLVSNTYGLYWNALTKATGDNYGSYDNGSNKHYLYDVRAGARLNIGSDVTADSSLQVLNGIWGKRGVRFSGLPTGVAAYRLMMDANGTVFRSDSTAGSSSLRFGVSGEDATAAQNRSFTHSGYQFQVYSENGAKEQLIKSLPDSTMGIELRDNSSADLAYVILAGIDSSTTIKGGRPSHGSAIKVSDAGIIQTPNTGIVNYDTLNYSGNTDDSMMVWRKSTGDVGMRAIPAGGSGANTALSNLSAVAINTSLLPATDDAIDLGSATKQWRDVYMTGASLYMDGVKTLQATGLTMPTGAGLRTRTSAANTLLLQAYDVDGAAYTTFGTLTAGNTPTFDLSTSTTIGGSTFGSLYQPLNSNLTTIAGLTPTSDNFMIANASAWASRTPTQATALLINVVGDAGAGGAKGLVPAPAAGDAAANKYLKADGTWTAIAGGGDMVLASVQSVTGLKTFDKDKLAMKGTFTGITTYSTANTSASNYTFETPAANITAAQLTKLTTSTSANTASTIAERDANNILAFNNVTGTYATTVSSAGTTTLTVSSKQTQYTTGTTTHTYTLPDATTLTAGMSYTFPNTSTGIITINKNGGTLVQTVAANAELFVEVTDVSTAAGVWKTSYSTNLNIGIGTAKTINFEAPTATQVALNIPVGVAQTTPVSGDFSRNAAGVFTLALNATENAAVKATQGATLTSDFTLSAASGVQTCFPSTADVWTLSASTAYEIEGHYFMTTGTTSKTTGIAFALGGGASVTLINISVIGANVVANATATAQGMASMQQVASTVVTAASTTAGVDIYFKGRIYMNAGGTVTPQINFSANPGGTNLMKAGSFIQFVKLGTNTFHTQGSVN